MRSAVVCLGLGLSLVFIAGCQGRGRQNLSLTPKPKDKIVEEAVVQFDQALVRIQLSFPTTTPEIKQINLRGLLCQDVTNPVDQGYLAKSAHQGDMQISVSLPVEMTSISCSSIAVETDQALVYSGVIPAASIAKNAAGEFVFPNVLLRAGATAPQAGQKASDDTISVDGNIGTCAQNQKFDVKSKQCK